MLHRDGKNRNGKMLKIDSWTICWKGDTVVGRVSDTWFFDKGPWLKDPQKTAKRNFTLYTVVESRGSGER